MSIELICGLPGHGKGCLAVDRIFKDLKRGKKVFCNFPIYEKLGSKVLHPKITFFETWDDVRDQANGNIFMDESQRWFSSRDFKNNRPEDLEFFQEHRHNGLNLRLICQHPGQLDVEIRDRLAAHVWYIKRLFGPTEDDEPSRTEKIVGWVASVRKYAASDFKSAKRHALFGYVMNLQQVHGWYDTHWRIGGRDGAGTGLGKALALSARARATGQDLAEQVNLSDGSQLTRESYLAGMIQDTPGGCWRFREPLEVGELIYGKDKLSDRENDRGGSALCGDGGGLYTGASGLNKNDTGGNSVVSPYRTVFKLSLKGI